MMLKEGIVISTTGSWYKVFEKQTQVITHCRLRGKLRLTDWNTTNPVAVGDKVFFSEEEDGNGLIVEIIERKNGIIRKAAGRTKQAHILAANLDQAILIATLHHPRTSLGFVDRFLVVAQAHGVPACIIWNKLDLYTEAEKILLTNYQQIYQQAGYPSFLLSALNPSDALILKSIFANKVSLLGGHSGTGKSTLVNALEASYDLKTQKVSHWSDKGVHTTTFSEMYPLPEYQAYLVDTPGIKEFGLFNINKAELGLYFPDFLPFISNCKFTNCSHTHETACGIKTALLEGRLSELRYQSYLSIWSSLED